MSRRKRPRPRIAPPGQSFASDLPRVRDWIVERRLLDAGSLTAHAGEAFQRLAQAAGGSDLVSQLVGRYRDEAVAYASEECALWWVTRAMTRLAYEAREDLPDWTPSMSRPSRCGVLLWDGGCGITPSTLPSDASVLGVTWHTTPEGEFAITPIVTGGDGPRGIRLGIEAMIVWHPDQARDEPLGRMLGTTWLLAQSPTVGVTHSIRYHRRDPERPFARPSLPGVITRITLRQTPGPAGSAQTGGVSRPGLSHQHIVRGHWRQQSCGPGRQYRKPVYVNAYVRGPEGTPLVPKPAVHVWRR